jgi:hypothetical protein
MGGGFGCDMGDLPAPPVAFAWLLVAGAIIGLIFGACLLITGRPLVRFGILNKTSTTRGGRLLGLALILDSIAAAFIAQAINFLSQHIEPPRWWDLGLLPLMLSAAALQWLVLRVDRTPRPARE